MSLLRAVCWVSQEVGAWPYTTSHVGARPVGLVASAHRARVANTHRRRGSALETVPCAAADAPRPVHLHRTLRRARKRHLARPRAAARARALPTGPHAAPAAFLTGASRAAAVRRVPLPHAIHATAAEPGSLRPPNRAPRTSRTIPSRLTTQKTRLERGQKPPPPQKHAKCTERRTHLKHSTPTTQQARVGDTNGGFCVSR